MVIIDKTDLGKIIRQARVRIPLTLQTLAAKSGVSPSHLARIEIGQRFPSATVLTKISGPLGFGEDELFTLAGYLSSPRPGTVSSTHQTHNGGELDPYVSNMLSNEPLAVQRAAIGILSIIKNLAKNTDK